MSVTALGSIILVLVLICAGGVLVTATTSVQASFTVCRGPDDNVELSKVLIQVTPSKQLALIDRVNEYAKMNEMSVGRVEVRAKGWITLILERRQANGVSLWLTNERLTHSFVGSIQTCNATVDWRPAWQAFEKFLREQERLLSEK